MTRGVLRRADRALDSADTWSLLERAFVGRLGTIGRDGWPYVVPRLFVVAAGSIGASAGGANDILSVISEGVSGEQRRIYFHCAAARGHTIENLEADARVCFEVDEPGDVFPAGDSDQCETSVSFASVIVFGECRPVADERAKALVFKLLMDKYADPAWGRPQGWSLATATAVYEIVVERLTGKSRPLPRRQ